MSNVDYNKGCVIPIEDWIWLNRVGCFESVDLIEYVAAFPPSSLISNVSGLDNEKDFASHGCDIYQALSEASPVPLTNYQKILDFGCGCGRLTRMFKGHHHEIYGCDIDYRHVEWVQRNLPYVQAKLVDIHPPLPYSNQFFDTIISISVFTHLNEANQDEFLGELHRIATPGSLLFITVHGQQALNRARQEKRIWDMLNMNPDLFKLAEQKFSNDQHAFILQQGHLTCKHSLVQKLKKRLFKLVVDQPFEYGIAFISERYIREHWSRWFDIVDYRPGAIHSFQDIFVLSPRVPKTVQI